MPRGTRLAAEDLMRFAVVIAATLLAGCEAARVYFQETEGITPAELLPIALQERQYVEDRNLEGKVKAVVGPSVAVDVYLKEVTLKGASPREVEAVKALSGVKSVKAE
jgi:hypothetical protein